METFLPILPLKKMACEVCDFVSSNKKDWDRHVLTRKHMKRSNGNQMETVFTPKFFACKCGKKYSSKSGLWKHSHKCDIEKTIVDNLISDNESFKSLIMEVIKSNSELQKQNNDLQKQVIEVCKNSNTTNINNNSNNNNSNNKTFNIQFFLNEQCKDAMNISDFVNTFDLQLKDLESVGELGYVEGITKLIVDKLNGMDVYKRPIHCSDAKREILYVKDENKWEKEERNNPKLRKAIKNISFNNLKLVVKWTDTYPESKNIESRLNDKYIKLVKQSTGGNGEISDNEDKIIRRIAKEIVIDKQ